MLKKIRPSSNKVACMYAKWLYENDYDVWHSSGPADVVRIFYDWVRVGKNSFIPLEEAEDERIHKVFEWIKQQWEKIEPPEKETLEELVKKFFWREILHKNHIPSLYLEQTLELYNRLKKLNEKGHIYPIPREIVEDNNPEQVERQPRQQHPMQQHYTQLKLPFFE